MSAEDASESVHQRLLNIRDTTGEQFNHLLMRYGLERLLCRNRCRSHGTSCCAVDYIGLSAAWMC